MSSPKSSPVLIVGMALAVAGCGGAVTVPHPGVAPAAGIVTYNGAPVDGAAVVFMSAETSQAGWVCSGHTNSEGEFEITSTFAPGTDAKGIPAGDYTAVVTKFEEPSSAPKSHDAHPAALSPGNNPTAAATSAKSAVPLKYATDQTSDLKFKIDSTGNGNLELRLVD